MNMEPVQLIEVHRYSGDMEEKIVGMASRNLALAEQMREEHGADAVKFPEPFKFSTFKNAGGYYVSVELNVLMDTDRIKVDRTGERA